MSTRSEYIMKDQVRDRVADLMGYEPQGDSEGGDGSGEQLPLLVVAVVALYLLALSVGMG